MNPSPAELESITKRAEQLLRERSPAGAAKVLAPVIDALQNSPRAMLTYARALAMLGQHVGSAEAFVIARRLDPKNASAAVEHAAILSRLGRLDAALNAVQSARAIRPWFGPAVFQEADLLVDMGKRVEAAQLLDRYQREAPASERTPVNRARWSIAAARLAPREVEAEPIIKELTSCTKDHALPQSLRMIAGTRVAGLLDAMGRYDEAFEAQTRAKALRPMPWDRSAFEERVQESIDFWSSDEARAVPAANIDGSGFVFIAGMPRTGSTLLEQMLSRHARVRALGERGEIMRAAHQIQPARPGEIPIVTNMQGNESGMIEKLAEEAVASYAPSREHDDQILVDKQPFNFAHLPLIARLLPGAKILHTVRDPRDTCLSYYMQWMVSPHPHTNTLEDLASFTMCERRMTNAWRSLEAPGLRPEMIDVSYEATTTRPEKVMREVCAFIGIEFDESMLSHTDSERVANTASKDQVKAGIYTSRTKRWKNYEKHLGPVIEVFGDADEA